jgi:hypothetical protein
MKNFTENNFSTIFPTSWHILLEDWHKDTIDAPLWWQKRGLSKTSTGYGTKIETSRKLSFCGRLYRVYCDIYSNCGTCYIITKKYGKIIVE